MYIQDIIDNLESIINQQDEAFEPLRDIEIEALEEAITILRRKD